MDLAALGMAGIFPSVGVPCTARADSQPRDHQEATGANFKLNHVTTHILMVLSLLCATSEILVLCSRIAPGSFAVQHDPYWAAFLWTLGKSMWKQDSTIEILITTNQVENNRVFYLNFHIWETTWILN